MSTDSFVAFFVLSVIASSVLIFTSVVYSSETHIEEVINKTELQFSQSAKNITPCQEDCPITVEP